MGLKSFRSVEQDTAVTALNGVSLARGIGGAILGGLLASRGIEPVAALTTASSLAATDMEGTMITATNRWPRFQQLFRIIPSSSGRKIDPVMDKVFAASVYIGASIGGEIPIAEAVPVLATEAATAASTVYITARGGDPDTPRAGVWGMVARCMNVVTNLSANVFQDGMPHEMLIGGGATSAVAAVVLGAMSCREVLRTPLPETV